MSTYNFDEEDKYIEFVLEGNTYQFWYPTAQQEIDTKTGGDNLKWLTKLVKLPEGATYDPFDKVYPKMNLKQVAAFTRMIETELGLSKNGDNKG